MSRVHPAAEAHEALLLTSDRREEYTIWMKSLVLHGNGLTVYNSGGEVAYRVDNYQSKSDGETFLMDAVGNIVFRIAKKKPTVLDTWEGYSGCEEELRRTELKPAFRVTKPFGFLNRSRSSQCAVNIRCDDGSLRSCRIDGLGRSSGYKIVDKAGRSMAEVKRKKTATGIVLGSDILRLVVEPSADRSLVMGLMVVIGLINGQI